MRVLFDQGTPVPIRSLLRDHEVKTAYEQGWSTLLNGELLRVAEEAGFDVLLTTDKNLVRQQNLKGRKIAVLVLSRNRWTLIKPAIGRVIEALNQARPGTFSVIDIPPK